MSLLRLIIIVVLLAPISLLARNHDALSLSSSMNNNSINVLFWSKVIILILIAILALFSFRDYKTKE